MVNTVLRLATAGLASAAGAVAVARRRAARRSEDLARWRVVSVLASPEEIAPGGVLPAPLAALGDAVDVELRPAPGSWGTEVAARLSRPDALPRAVAEEASDEPVARLRRALREAKQLVEVGEVLRAKPRPEGHRPATVGGALIDQTESSADRGGVL